MQRKYSTQYLAIVAMFSAVGFVLVLIFKIVPPVAGFLSYEPKDAFIAIAGFILGPLASIFISVIVSLIEMVTISSTGLYGFVMNVVATCSFALPPTIIYAKHRDRKTALKGLVAGVICMAVSMLLWNYIITPFYMGVPRAAVASMLLPVFLPFNLGKGIINAAIAFFLYKPLVGSLRKAGLAPKR